MSSQFGFVDIILLALFAGFIILRLRNVLGRKTGHEGKVVSSLSEKKFEEFKKTIKLKKQPTEFDTNQKKQFLKGAEIAYETIINSFAKGDKKNLKDLVTKEMNKNFESAINLGTSSNLEGKTPGELKLDQEVTKDMAQRMISTTVSKNKDQFMSDLNESLNIIKDNHGIPFDLSILHIKLKEKK